MGFNAGMPVLVETCEAAADADHATAAVAVGDKSDMSAATKSGGAEAAVDRYLRGSNLCLQDPMQLATSVARGWSANTGGPNSSSARCKKKMR